jgi:hypothetical protein
MSFFGFFKKLHIGNRAFSLARSFARGRRHAGPEWPVAHRQLFEKSEKHDALAKGRHRVIPRRRRAQ